MDQSMLEQTLATLVAKNEQLQQENNRMQTSMFNLFKENSELKDKIQTEDTMSKSIVQGKTVSILWPNTLNESQFRKHLKKRPQRTSSPMDITSFTLSYSMPRDSDARVESVCGAASVEEQRLIGEVAYQLDQRILGGIFRGRKRRYGYSLINIKDKIKEVSTNILSGVVDKGYQLLLTTRYYSLIKQLNQLGYKTSLHPSFSELIVNTYGILVEKRSESQEVEHNDQHFLRRFIKNNAPVKFHKDLMVLLNCLCFLAEKDGSPLMVW